MLARVAGASSSRDDIADPEELTNQSRQNDPAGRQIASGFSGRELDPQVGQRSNRFCLDEGQISAHPVVLPVARPGGIPVTKDSGPRHELSVVTALHRSTGGAGDMDVLDIAHCPAANVKRFGSSRIRASMATRRDGGAGEIRTREPSYPGYGISVADSVSGLILKVVAPLTSIRLEIDFRSSSTPLQRYPFSGNA